MQHWYSLKANYLVKIDFGRHSFPDHLANSVFSFCLLDDKPADESDQIRHLTWNHYLYGPGIARNWTFSRRLGAAFSIQVAVLAAPGYYSIPAFSGFFINVNTFPPYMIWITYISFMRYGFERSMLAIYGYDRATLVCCHYR